MLDLGGVKSEAPHCRSYSVWVSYIGRQPGRNNKTDKWVLCVYADAMYEDVDLSNESIYVIPMIGFLIVSNLRPFVNNNFLPRSFSAGDA